MTLKELRKLTNEQLREERDARIKVIQDRSDAARQKENLKYVGRCFEGENSVNEVRRWPTYTKVIGCEGGRLSCFKFQAANGGFGGLLQVALYPNLAPDSLGVPIPRAEFDAAWRKFIAGINAIHKPTTP